MIISGLEVTNRRTRNKGERWVKISTVYGILFQGIVSELETRKLAATLRVAADQLEK
jgi:hypothetical protein